MQKLMLVCPSYAVLVVASVLVEQGPICYVGASWTLSRPTTTPLIV